MEEWAIEQLVYFKAGLKDNLVVQAQKYTDGGDHYMYGSVFKLQLERWKGANTNTCKE